MATYVTLFRYTQPGITTINDFAALVEAPDDITAAKASLTWGSQGNVSSETLRAFTEEEFRSIAAALP